MILLKFCFEKLKQLSFFLIFKNNEYRWIEISEWISSFDYNFVRNDTRAVSMHIRMGTLTTSSCGGERTFDGTLESIFEVDGSSLNPSSDKNLFKYSEKFQWIQNGSHKANMKTIYCFYTGHSHLLSVKSTENNDFKLFCRVELSSESKNLENISGNVGTSATADYIGKLLDSQVFSDFTFNVSGKEFKVHKIILSSASPYFETLFSSDFKENEKNVLVNNEKPDIFRLLLEYIYKGKLPENFSEVAMDLYEMAHLYQMETLEKYCLSHVYSDEINKDNALKFYKFASQYKLEDLFEQSWIFIKK